MSVPPRASMCNSYTPWMGVFQIVTRINLWILKIKYKIIEIIHILSNYTSNRLNHSSNLMAGGVMSFSHGGGGR